MSSVTAASNPRRIYIVLNATDHRREADHKCRATSLVDLIFLVRLTLKQAIQHMIEIDSAKPERSARPTGMSKYKWQRFLFRFGAKRTLRGVRTAVWIFSTSRERALAFKKLDSALGLIEKYAPEKFGVLQLDVQSILGAGDPTCLGRYLPDIRMVELDLEYVLDVKTTPESLTCTLIHEAQHARLFRLGFGYDETVRGRIERLCFRAQRNFARQLPNGEELVADAEAWMAADPELYFSKKAHRRARLKALTELGCPDWIIKTIAWLSRRHAT